VAYTRDERLGRVKNGKPGQITQQGLVGSTNTHKMIENLKTWNDIRKK